MDTDRRSRIVLLAIGGIVVVLIAVAVVMAVQPPPQFDPATPEGAAQGYFSAVLDRDAALAFTYLTDDIGDVCSSGELRRATPDGARVVIANTEITGDEARVDVEITETWGEGPFGEGPFGAGPNTFTFDETLVMERSGNRWLISETPWPIHVSCP
jgi:hypothetical protein